MTHLILIILTLNKWQVRYISTQLKLNKANSSDTETPFLDLNLSISNVIVSSKIYDKRNVLILK